MYVVLQSSITLYIVLQIDLRFEAECLEILVTNFEDEPQIRFPTPIRPYCKRDVLVETFEVNNFSTPYTPINVNPPWDPEQTQRILKRKKMRMTCVGTVTTVKILPD